MNKTQTQPAVPIAVGAAEPDPPVWIEVDLQAIQRNFRRVRSFVPASVRILSVVKANAYGHGLVPVAQALEGAGADFLGVASVAEGVLLRQAGLRSAILVLGNPLPEEAGLILDSDLTQAIGDWDCARALSAAAQAAGREVSVHLKVDTGMGRYGVWHEEALELASRIRALPGVRLGGVFTHFAKAGTSVEASRAQLNHFEALLARFRAAGVSTGLTHAANSVGTLRFPEAHLNLVRPGLLMYGASPIRAGEDGPLPELEGALTLKSRVHFLKTIPVGRTVSYGGTFKAQRPTVVATIPVGYAHGYSRALSNRARLLIGGHSAPVIGLVTMEDLMCDVTDIPGVRVGAEAVLIGRQGSRRIKAEELARHARTIPYEILAGLSARIPRRYAPQTLPDRG
ncbi:MAG: alanine racemase [Candidatus Omnitrophica bacterium CG11_big_fil_rev_8_21_14_0_20_64_10]|nr:MAG: alanine racemase [Candidatus Omnitrophica bacterium CG11_big_fil_rev_8_21_14_0_20_64_10]